jgi:hypothetical protein
MTEARLFSVKGIDIWAADLPGSISADVVAGEMEDDCYGLDRIDFAPGDVVLDVGAHVGLFAAYVGLRHPGVAVHSFEPFPDTFKLLRETVERNRVSNVRIYPFGISGDQTGHAGPVDAQTGTPGSSILVGGSLVVYSPDSLRAGGNLGGTLLSISLSGDGYAVEGGGHQ